MTSMPEWEEVDVDLSNHVFRERLASPGTERQLLAAAAKAASPTLPTSAPVALSLVRRPGGGRFAFLITVHHAQWDGMAMFRLMGETLPDSPRARTIRAPWEGLSTWKSRSDAPKAAGPGALRQAANLLSDSVRAVADIGKAFANHGTGLIAGSVRRPLPFGAPEVRAERSGSSLRTYGMSRLPLARVKALAKATEASVNDVLTTVVDAAYRAYLTERGAAADTPLVELVPVALKVPGAGNQISGFVAKLGEARSAPLARLAEIRKSMATGKADIGRMSASGAKLFAMINMGVAAGPDLLRVGERMPVTANMLISNPYGIPKPLFYLAGSRSTTSCRWSDPRWGYAWPSAS
jgi:WS/DGAT/MGAT family acyltransferase